jgi:hypothetical protein
MKDMMHTRFRIDVRCGNKDPKTGKITWVTKKEHNLINNDGLAMLKDYWVTQCTENVYLETGGGVNARYSGSTLVTQTGTSITSDAAFFLNDQSDSINNRLLVFDSGAETYITGYNDVDDVDAGTSQNIPAQPATIYYVEETHMDTFAKASTTYETTPGSNENTWAVASNVLTITNKRTVEFPVEASDITYKGVGWTPLTGDDQAVFGRKVIDIPVSAATQPVVEVTITRKMNVDVVPFTNIFTGVTVDGDYMNMMGSASYNGVAYYSSINTSTGATVAPTAPSTFLECKASEDMKMALGEYTSALDLTNIDITGSTYVAKTVTPSYTPGTYYVDYTATFTRNDIETANLRTIALLNDADDAEAFWRYLFDSSVDFTSKRFKNLTIRKSWSRYF